MGTKLLWTAVAVFLVGEAYIWRNANGITVFLFFAAAVIAIIGCILVWLRK